MNPYICSSFTIMLQYFTVNPTIEDDSCWSPGPMTPLILATIEQELPDPSIDWSPGPMTPLILATIEQELQGPSVDRSPDPPMVDRSIDEQPTTSSGILCKLYRFINLKIRLIILSFLS
jgi:hypothetical protein